MEVNTAVSPNYRFMASIKAELHWDPQQVATALSFREPHSLRHFTLFLATQPQLGAWREFRLDYLDPLLIRNHIDPEDPGRLANRGLGRWNHENDGGPYQRPRIDLCIRRAVDAVISNNPKYRDSLLEDGKLEWTRMDHYVNFMFRVVNAHLADFGRWENEDEEEHLPELCKLAFYILDKLVYKVLWIGAYKNEGRKAVPDDGVDEVFDEYGHGNEGQRRRQRQRQQGDEEWGGLFNVNGGNRRPNSPGNGSEDEPLMIESDTDSVDVDEKVPDDADNDDIHNHRPFEPPRRKAPDYRRMAKGRNKIKNEAKIKKEKGVGKGVSGGGVMKNLRTASFKRAKDPNIKREPRH